MTIRGFCVFARDVSTFDSDSLRLALLMEDGDPRSAILDLKPALCDVPRFLRRESRLQGPASIRPCSRRDIRP